MLFALLAGRVLCVRMMSVWIWIFPIFMSILYAFSRFLLILFSYSNLLKMKAGGSEYGYLLLHLRWIYSMIGFTWVVMSLPDIFLHNIIDVEIQSLIPGGVIRT